MSYKLVEYFLYSHRYFQTSTEYLFFQFGPTKDHAISYADRVELVSGFGGIPGAARETRGGSASRHVRHRGTAILSLARVPFHRGLDRPSVRSDLNRLRNKHKHKQIIFILCLD